MKNVLPTPNVDWAHGLYGNTREISVFTGFNVRFSVSLTFQFRTATLTLDSYQWNDQAVWAY